MNQKEIILKKTDFGDFRGRTMGIEFSPGVNRFFGMNGTGKTTLFDGHTWLTTGKNSLGKKKFDIKTISEGKTVSGSEHSVDSIYIIDGVATRLGRFYSEKWTKTRGAVNATKTGNTTVYRIDNKKIAEKKFNAFVDDLFQSSEIDTGIFDKEITPNSIYKIVSDPAYFATLSWSARRKILGQMEGVNIDTEAIINELGLRPFLFKSQKNDGTIIEYTVEEKKAVCEDRQKEIKEDLVSHKAKVEEHQLILNKATEQPEQLTLGKAKEAVLRAGQKVDKAQGKIDKFKSGDNVEAKKRLKELNIELTAADKQFSESKRKAQAEYNNVLQNITSKKNELSNLEYALVQKQNSLSNIRNEYKTQTENIKNLRASQPPEDETTCFNCGQDLPSEMIADAKQKFNSRKSEKLKSEGEKLTEIESRGTKVKQDKIDCEQKIQELQKEISELEKTEEPAILSIEKNLNICNLEKEIETLNSQTAEKEVPEELTTGLSEAKEGLKKSQEDEAAVKSVEGSKERIKELTDKKTTLSNEFNDLEKTLALIGEYNREVANRTEAIVNQMFDGNVTFRMFTVQENGNLNPTCDIMMDGKPYETALSTGEKVQAGLHIINTMQKHFGLYAPVFIENAESVSIIPEMDCQTFELHHDLKVRTLTQE
jgi:chromosome segregation ATPase